MRQTFHVIEDGTARGGEARHGLEIGIGEVRDVATHHEWQRAEKAEDAPGEGDDEERLATTEGVVGIAADTSQGEACRLCKQD